jgi:hypothetical protein
MSGTAAAQIDPVVLAVHPGERMVKLQLLVPLVLLYFRGHFPRLAILPGWCKSIGRSVFGRRHFPLGASNPTTLQVKFRRLVRPGERLTLDTRPSTKGCSSIIGTRVRLALRAILYSNHDFQTLRHRSEPQPLSRDRWDRGSFARRGTPGVRGGRRQCGTCPRRAGRAARARKPGHGAAPGLEAGKGGAVIEGFERAAAGRFSHAIQIDADGQHDLTALPDLLASSSRHPDALILVRRSSTEAYPRAAKSGDGSHMCGSASRLFRRASSTACVVFVFIRSRR